MLPDELIVAIKHVAADRRVYPNVVVARACEEFIARHRAEAAARDRTPAAAS